MKGLINRILPFSSVDGPGNRTAVFLQGCNFDCRYCHNPETINLCIGCGECLPHCVPKGLKREQGRIKYDHTRCVFCDECFRHCPHDSSPRVREMTAQEVMAEVRKNIPFVRGLTVSGGECTLQRDFLLELLTLAKADGLNTLLDSNGSYDFSADSELMSVVDGVMLDIKAWSSDDHLRVTGAENGNVIKNLEWLLDNGKLVEVRTVIVPDLFDVRETVLETAKTIARFPQDNLRMKLIRYRPMGVRERFLPMEEPDDGLMQELLEAAHKNGIKQVVIT